MVHNWLDARKYFKQGVVKLSSTYDMIIVNSVRGDLTVTIQTNVSIETTNKIIVEL